MIIIIDDKKYRARSTCILSARCCILLINLFLRLATKPLTTLWMWLTHFCTIVPERHISKELAHMLFLYLSDAMMKRRRILLRRIPYSTQLRSTIDFILSHILSKCFRTSSVGGLGLEWVSYIYIRI